MALRFIDPKTGSTIGSTELGRAVLAEAIRSENAALVSNIQNQSEWRKKYQGLFAQVAKAEFATKHSALEIASAGLTEFERRVVTESGEPLIDVVKAGWRNGKDLVATVVITGSGVLEVPKVDDQELEGLVANHSAEAGIIPAIKSVRGIQQSQIKKDLLIALAGGAEYSPTRLWLDWGGDVAIVARARVELWRELISRARSGAGTLLVPVLQSKLAGLDIGSLSDEQLASLAGLDLVEDAGAIAGWLAELAKTDSRRIVLGSYAYAPGVKHIEVQAVQHCLARTLTESLPKTRVVLSWLATPTDSHSVPAEFAEDVKARYNQRSYLTRLRDEIASPRSHKPELFSSAEGVEYALIDPTSSRQGPSYALAKRLQRWLAYQQVGSGRQVAYIVAPPAKTDSVLSHRILRATYRGGPSFGLHPYETDQAVRISALLLLSRLHSPEKYSTSDLSAMYCKLAVHGGLWRSIYAPSELWLAATVWGFWGYFSKH